MRRDWNVCRISVNFLVGKFCQNDVHAKKMPKSDIHPLGDAPPVEALRRPDLIYFNLPKGMI
jgi:hypothetical protein